MQFEDFVGLRYLMAKRDRNMLSVITLISVGGVAVGVMALIVVLSVMGGFEADFRDKIIGSKAHVVISPHEGYLEDYERIAARAREVAGVMAASSFVEAEVMLNSPTNLQTAILRGVHIEELPKTSRILEYMKEGNLEYLEDPSVLPSIEAAGSVVRSGNLTLHSDLEDGALSPERIESLERAGARASIAFTGSKHGAWLAGEKSLDSLLEERETLAQDIKELEETERLLRETAQVFGLDSGAPEESAAKQSDRSSPAEAGPEEASELSFEDETLATLLAEIGQERWLESEVEPREAAALESVQGLDFEREPTASVTTGTEAKRVMPSMLGMDPREAGLRKVGGIILGQELKQNLNLFLGAELNVMSPTGDLGPGGGLPKSRPFKLVGSYYSGMFDFDAKMGYVSLKDAQALLGIGDRVSGIDIRCRTLEDSVRVRDRLREVFAGEALKIDDWMTLNSSLFGAIMLEKVAMFVILTSIILVASFNILCLLIMMVIEKAREIAIFKAMGCNDRSIVRIFVVQGAVIGGLGTLIGLGLGLASCWAIASLGIRLPGGVYYITQIPVTVRPLEIVLICFAAIGISLLATVLPSAMAVRLKPVDGLRHD